MPWSASRACLLSLVALLVAGASPAGAVRIEVTPDALLFTAAPNELNRVAVNAGEPGRLRLLDSSDIFPGAVSAPVEVVEPCVVVAGGGGGGGARAASVLHGAPTIVECPARPRVVALLADHADAFVLDTSVAASARVDAGSGGDLVTTGAGVDEITGGDGRDTLAGGGGGDRLDGGPGADTVRYDTELRQTGVRVAGRRGGSREDGPGDVLASIENAYGTQFADVLVGDARANELQGAAGADRLTGGGGADALLGGPGRDRLDGGPGGDRIDSRDDERERVECGRGADSLSRDARDRAGRDCETVGTASASTFDPPLGIAGRARRRRDGRIGIRLTCPLPAPCEGTLLVRGGGRAQFEVGAEKSATVAVRGPRGGGRVARVTAVTNEDTPYVLRTTRRVSVSAPTR